MFSYYESFSRFLYEMCFASRINKLRKRKKHNKVNDIFMPEECWFGELKSLSLQLEIPLN